MSEEPDAIRESVSWFGLTFDFNGLSRGVYVLGLLLAAVALIAIFLHGRTVRARAIRNVLGTARATAILLWFWVLHDSFGSSFMLPMAWLTEGGKGDEDLLGTLSQVQDAALFQVATITMALSFLALASLWLSGARRTKANVRTRWRELRPLLEVLAVPPAVLGGAFVVGAAFLVKLPGLPAHYLAVTLLAHGFARLQLRDGDPPGGFHPVGSPRGV